jgi:hypothetical protein
MPRRRFHTTRFDRPCAALALLAALASAHADERALIGAGAFAGARGVIALNQASGVGNSQANSVVLGAGASLAIVTDGQLAAVSPSPGPAAGPATTMSRTALIEPGAFHATSGVVQVNQTAGLGNATGNAFVLQTPGLSLSNSRSLQ